MITRIARTLKNNDTRSLAYKLRWNALKYVKFPKTKNENDIIVIVASAQRAGSNWLSKLIMEAGDFKYGKLDFDNDFVLCIELDTPRLGNYFFNLRGRNIYKTHSESVPHSSLGGAKVVSIYRDPRDVITSCAFYLGRIEERKGGGDRKYREMSDTEKIIYLIKNGLWLYKPLKSWYDCTYSLNLCYEKLLDDPVGGLKKTFEFLKMEVEDGDIMRSVENNSFEKSSGRKPGEESKSSFFRKGITGDWKNYFDEDCVKFLKEAHGGIWNELIVEMGYEKNLNWTL